jgi:hypothetical protein
MRMREIRTAPLICQGLNRSQALRSLSALLVVLALLRAPGLALAQSGISTEGCDAAFAVDGVRWDGLPMERYTWGGNAIDLEPIGGAPVAVCIAGGPPEQLPITNSIGCVLVDGKLALVEDRVVCGAFQSIEREGDDALLWIAHATNATVDVTPFHWNGSAFDQENSYEACGDQVRVPIQNPNDCLRR